MYDYTYTYIHVIHIHRYIYIYIHIYKYMCIYIYNESKGRSIREGDGGGASRHALPRRTQYALGLSICLLVLIHVFHVAHVCCCSMVSASAFDREATKNVEDVRIMRNLRLPDTITDPKLRIGTRFQKMNLQHIWML